MDISAVSTSLRGRELKYKIQCPFEYLSLVDLLVRSWVEICMYGPLALTVKVDLFVRSWVEILELPYRLHGEKVDLFVRSWVEIQNDTPFIVGVSSTSSWGRELKWNCNNFVLCLVWSTSSWGRELKFHPRRLIWIRLKVDLFVRSWVEMHHWF